jgi:hypothetical protein
VFGADLDGDGDVDLIAANRGSNSLSVLLNSGAGTFAGQVAYAVDSEPRAVFAADFDGDGDQDLVSGNWGANNVSVLFNYGDGTFAAHVAYSVGADPWGIFGADLDGDGDVDLVTPDNGADQVSVLLNQPLAVPEAPDLVSPYNGVYTTDHTPTLNWTDVATATSYETVVDDDYYFGSISRSQSGLMVSQWTVSPSLGDDTWYWKARAYNEVGAGPWSEIWHFTTYTYLPSCPVLFTYDGHAYQEENTILTACEKSAYVDVVTDYYWVTGPVVPQNGMVRFQIREMEDETTYLHDLELIVVDHADNTKVACSVDGIIDTYKETLAPLSAVDHNGVDRLAELIETDGNRFTSEESGYLIVTFPKANEPAAAFKMETEIKPRPCAVKGSGVADNSPDQPIPGGELRVHILDSDGFWVPLPAMPSRDQAADEIVFTDLTKRIDTDVIVVRLSWEKGYSTDAIGQLISAEETPVVRTYRVDAFEVERATPAAKTFSGFAEADPLVLRNGDLLEVSFAVGPPVESDMTRDYIIRAVGRYQPDYAVYPHLLPKQFQLHRNYPNPFNPLTIVSYDIPVAAHVKLEIYNVLGQRVTILVDETQQAGRYQVEWNSRDHSGSPVASGVYFYRLTANDFVESRKMVLLR